MAPIVPARSTAGFTSRSLVRSDGRTLVDVLRSLGIPEAEVAITAVNREIVRLEGATVDADAVHLYPPTSGGARPAVAET